MPVVTKGLICTPFALMTGEKRGMKVAFADIDAKNGNRRIKASIEERFAAIVLMRTSSSPGQATIPFDLDESEEGAGHI